MNELQYLAQISSRINTTNDKLDDIQSYLEIVEADTYAIKQAQATLISGDKIITQNQNIIAEHIVATNLILILLILYTFIKGCFRC